MKKKVLFFSIAISMGLLVFLSGCTYTAPFRRMEAVSPEATVSVTLSAVEHQKGQRRPFLADTKRVLADLPNQAGLVGYSLRFQLLGNKAWTMTAWKNEASRDQSAKSPVHLAAVRRSRLTAQNMRFIPVSMPAGSLPMTWDEAIRLLDKAPAYEYHAARLADILAGSGDRLYGLAGCDGGGGCGGKSLFR